VNIFALDRDPVRAAQMQCDKHVVKMTLETGQMLSTIQRAYSMFDKNNPADQALDALLYRPTHIHHPCTLWAGRSAENYGWLVRHFYALAGEYTYRYNKEHLTFQKLHKIVAKTPEKLKDRHGMTPFALAMPDEYKVGHCVRMEGDSLDAAVEDAVTSYRRYYVNDKANILFYTKRPRPEWLTEMLYAV